ncbi:MAG TPA: hypothetical protein GYA03_06855 [Tissierellia bacterium]|nr:hypothetical protein [Tissierellia bacterium]
MAVNIYGGGANTNANGLRFEQETSLSEALNAAGYVLDKNGYVFRSCFSEKPIALSAPKYKLYERILNPSGVNWREIISKQMLPDEALLNLRTNTIYIIEKKFQNCSGSVDEKLQTCGFKKMQYQKLFAPLGIGVEYFYVCNDWFLRDEYRDVRDYIVSVGCHIFFNEIPLHYLGL